MAASVTPITENDLFFMVASLAQFTVECEDVIWHPDPVRGLTGGLGILWQSKVYVFALALRNGRKQGPHKLERGRAYHAHGLYSLHGWCVLGLWQAGEPHDSIEYICSLLSIVARFTRPLASFRASIGRWAL